MCKHHYIYEPQGNRISKGTCKFCGDTIAGLNGLPDNIYNFDNSFLLQSNPKRVMDNDIERILHDTRYPHIFQRKYIDKKYETVV